MDNTLEKNKEFASKRYKLSFESLYAISMIVLFSTVYLTILVVAFTFLHDGYLEWFRKDGTKMRSGNFTKDKQIGEWITYDKKRKVFKVTQTK